MIDISNPRIGHLQAHGVTAQVAANLIALTTEVLTAEIDKAEKHLASGACSDRQIKLISDIISASKSEIAMRAA